MSADMPVGPLLRAVMYQQAAGEVGDLGRSLRIARKAHRLSLRDVSGSSGVGVNVLFRLEHGKTCSHLTAAVLLGWLSDLYASNAPEGPR